jgi:hypothetical protein
MEFLRKKATNQNFKPGLKSPSIAVLFIFLSSIVSLFSFISYCPFRIKQGLLGKNLSANLKVLLNR